MEGLYYPSSENKGADLLCSYCTADLRLLCCIGKNQNKQIDEIRAVAGQRSSPDLCFVTKSITSMTKDIDLNVTQVGRDGTA